MIKLIDESTYLDFIGLYVDMMKHIELYKNTPTSVIVSDLTSQVVKNGFFAIGDFNDNTLVGFICGYRESDTTWFQSGLYHKIPYRVLKLINYVENKLKLLGYTSWTTEYSKQDNKCLAPKLGAKIQTIRYIKEI